MLDLSPHTKAGHDEINGQTLAEARRDYRYLRTLVLLLISLCLASLGAIPFLPFNMFLP